MARHRSPQGRRASLGLLSPQFAVAGVGGAAGFRTAGPYVRHSRPSASSPLRTPSGRIAVALVAVGGIAGTAHLSTQGTLLPAADEVSGWFTTSGAAVPAPRGAADAAPIADPAAIAALGSAPAAGAGSSPAATALTGAGVRDIAGRAASATEQARETARTVRARQAAAAAAAATSAAAAAPSAAASGAEAGSGSSEAASSTAGGAVRILTGRVTSGFGERGGTAHNGLDIAAPIGTPIYVPLAGTVISSGSASGFGMWVRVRHSDGTVTVYGHINRSLVSVGQTVAAGQQIAEVGNRGQSSGPHLHIEVVTPEGTKINPRPWLDERGFRYAA